MYPVCLQCGKKLKPYKWHEEEWAKERDLGWGRKGDNLFCGINCGYQYGVHSARHQQRPDESK